MLRSAGCTSAGLAVGGASTLLKADAACPSSATTIADPMNGEPRIRLAAVGIVDVLRPRLIERPMFRSGMVCHSLEKTFGRWASSLLYLWTAFAMTDPISVAQHRCSQPLGRLIWDSSQMLSLTVECTRLLVACAALDSLEAARASNDQLKVELAKELKTVDCFAFW